MTRKAWAYVWLVMLVGALAIGLALAGAAVSLDELPTFLTLTGLATIAQLFKVEAPGRQSYHTSFIFIFAALVLLSPSLTIILITISLLAEWAKERLMNTPLLRNWYLQPFNISTLIITALAARWVYDVILANPIPGVGLPGWFPAVVASAVSFVVINHLLIGLALALARGISLRRSGVLDAENLAAEIILIFMGFLVASLWTINLWLIPLALSPLVLMYRALKVPMLKHEAQVDAKTGLWNARHFAKLFMTELERAKRFDRPIGLIMADLDLLRNINNTYGHLAGDAVLAQIGEIVRKTVRGYDVAARFGGEEFTIALPETGAFEANNIAERLRRAIESHEFRIMTSPAPLHVTMSVGMAIYPADAATAAELIHAADTAVFQAKLQGRNCTVSASEVPDSVKLSLGSVDERLAVPYSVPFIARPETASAT